MSKFNPSRITDDHLLKISTPLLSSQDLVEDCIVMANKYINEGKSELLKQLVNYACKPDIIPPKQYIALICQFNYDNQARIDLKTFDFLKKVNRCFAKLSVWEARVTQLAFMTDLNELFVAINAKNQINEAVIHIERDQPYMAVNILHQSTICDHLKQFLSEQELLPYNKFFLNIANRYIAGKQPEKSCLYLKDALKITESEEARSLYDIALSQVSEPVPVKISKPRAIRIYSREDLAVKMNATNSVDEGSDESLSTEAIGTFRTSPILITRQRREGVRGTVVRTVNIRGGDEPVVNDQLPAAMIHSCRSDSRNDASRASIQTGGNGFAIRISSERKSLATQERIP